MSFAKERTKVQTATSASKVPEPPKGTTPWKPANLTAPPPGWSRGPEWGGRWVRADGRMGDDRLAAKQEEGWVLWRQENPKGKAATGGDPNVDGTDISGTARRRNLVWMELSPERKAARNRYLWEMNQGKMEALKDPKAEAQREGGEKKA